jgi:hypothetical protein
VSAEATPLVGRRVDAIDLTRGTLMVVIIFAHANHGLGDSAVRDVLRGGGDLLFEEGDEGGLVHDGGVQDFAGLQRGGGLQHGGGAIAQFEEALQRQAEGHQHRGNRHDRRETCQAGGHLLVAMTMIVMCVRVVCVRVMSMMLIMAMTVRHLG